MQGFLQILEIMYTKIVKWTNLRIVKKYFISYQVEKKLINFIFMYFFLINS